MSNVLTLPTNRTKYSFDQILSNVSEQNYLKSDLLASPQSLWVNNDGKLVIDKVPYEMTEWALNQICARLRIPYTYVAKCPPVLQSKNINNWIKRSPEEGTKWFIRLIKDNNGIPIVRGILSESYSEFDNINIIEILSNTLQGTDGEIVLWQPDKAEGGFHLRVAFPSLTEEVGTLPDGRKDLIQTGLHFSNSEVGKRSITVAPMVYRLVCTNGLMRWDIDGEVFRQRHIHVKRNEIYERVAVAVKNGIVQGKELVNTFAASKLLLVEDPMAIIENLGGYKDTFYFSKKTIEEVKTNYVIEKSSELDTMYDVVNALTRTAQSLESDRRVALERFAFRLLTA